MSAETKFNIQHFEIFFLFFPENKNLFFFVCFFVCVCVWGGGGGGGACGRGREVNINLSLPAELAQTVKRLRCTYELTVILKYACEIYK